MKNKNKQKVLLQAYWFSNQSCEKDSTCFIGYQDNNKSYGEQFTKYAKRQGWGKIKEEDIEGVYEISTEEDMNGKSYKIIIE